MPAPQIEHDVTATCRALFAPNQVVEVRVLGINQQDGHNAGGWFDDHQTLAAAVARYDTKRPVGIYCTMNVLHPGCLARTNNTIVDRIRTLSSDADISDRNWLLLDVDAVRPSGVSSTIEELNAAHATAQQIAGVLQDDLHFPPGLRACSGNGVHLLYRITLPNDDPSKRVLSRLLRTLSTRFSTLAATVDTSVFNAARIVRLYGTTVRKGANVSSRPWRVSSIICDDITPSFSEFEPVSVALLREAASVSNTTTDGPSTKRTPTVIRATHVDLDEWIGRYHIPVRKTEKWYGGIRHILECCPFDPSHTGTSAVLGRTAKGAIFFKCQHQSCADRTWKDLRRHVGDTRRSRVASSDVREISPDNPYMLACTFLEEQFTDSHTDQVTLKRWQDQFYLWSSTRACYQPFSDDSLKVLVTRWVGQELDKFTGRLVLDLVSSVRAIVTIVDDPRLAMPFTVKLPTETFTVSTTPSTCHRLTMVNGIVSIQDLILNPNLPPTLEPHSPTWFAAITLPYECPKDQSGTQDYTPPAPVRWLAFLDEIFDQDQQRIDLIQEMFGYCLRHNLRLEKFFVFCGVGRNGKSTVLDTLYHLLGPENVSSLGATQLAERFTLCELQHRLANLSADMGELDGVNEGLLKALVSGDPVIVDRKYSRPVELRNNAVLVFATNVLPRFRDSSIGIWRRLILVPFDHVVPLDKVDPQLVDKLLLELPAIFLWAISGLRRLYTNLTFTMPQRCKTAAQVYRVSCFPVLTFADECTTTAPDKYGNTPSVSTSELWRAYRTWCTSCGLTKPKPLHVLATDMLRFFPGLTVDRVQYSGRISTHSIIYGIRLKDHVVVEQQPQYQ